MMKSQHREVSVAPYCLTQHVRDMPTWCLALSPNRNITPGGRRWLMRLERKILVTRLGKSHRVNLNCPVIARVCRLPIGCTEIFGVAAFVRHQQCWGGLSCDVAASRSSLLLQVTPTYTPVSNPVKRSPIHQAGL